MIDGFHYLSNKTLFFIKTTQGAGKEQIFTKDDFFFRCTHRLRMAGHSNGNGPWSDGLEEGKTHGEKSGKF